MKLDRKGVKSLRIIEEHRFLAFQKRCMPIALKRNTKKESKLEDSQCGFRPGYSTTNQTFTLRQIFEKSWEYAKDICMLC